MSRASNPLCGCRKSGAWTTKEAAEAALRRVQSAPEDLGRGYRPIAVERCTRGVWHLTAKDGKRWKHGRRGRHRGR